MKYNLNNFKDIFINNRGYDKDFFNPSIKHCYDTKTLRNYQWAKETIIDAINQDKKIVVYGDIDIDGVTSSMIAYNFLLEQGLDVTQVYQQKKDGHEVTNKDLFKKSDLLIVLDYGTNNIDFFSEIIQKGITKEVLILDHHIQEEIVEDDFVCLINPMQSECPYPNKAMSAGLLTWKFFKEIEDELNDDVKIMDDIVDLAMLSIVSDFMNVSEMENRFFYYYGASSMSNKGLLGIIKKKYRNSEAMGLDINTKLNAAIKADKIELVYELLKSKDDKRIKAIIKELDKLYRTNKNLIADIIENDTEVLLKTDSIGIYKIPNKYISHSSGIVGKLKREYDISTIVLYQKDLEKEGLSGTARSDVDLKNIIKESKSDVSTMGHASAFGLYIHTKKGLDKFISEMSKVKIKKEFTYELEFTLNEMTSDVLRFVEYVNYLTGSGVPKFNIKVNHIYIKDIKKTGSGNGLLIASDGTRIAKYSASWCDNVEDGKYIMAIGVPYARMFGENNKELMVDTFEVIDSEDMSEDGVSFDF